MINSLWRDELGATLTTELLLLSTLTVAGVMTMAEDMREGFQQKTRRLVSAIVTAGDEYIADESDWHLPVEQCVVIGELDDTLPTE